VKSFTPGARVTFVDQVHSATNVPSGICFDVDHFAIGLLSRAASSEASVC